MRLFLLAAMVCAFTLPVHAQKEYSPDSPEVKSVVDRAVGHLNSSSFSGELRVLVALAIAEASKRYDGTVPRDNKIIQGAVRQIIAGVDGGSLLKSRALYHPCLAMILLCEVDDVAYRSQILKLLKSFEERQLEGGGFGYIGHGSWDTSQTQYVALAYHVARNHNLPVSLDSARAIFEFLLNVQDKGTWVYSAQEGGRRISIHAAASGTVYLLGDLLQLQPRVKVDKKRVSGLGLDLPPSILMYIEPPKIGDKSVKGLYEQWNKEGPLIDFERTRFRETKARANAVFESKFVIKAKRWPFYYLYAFERYAYFREQAEGDLGGRAMKSWYDQTFEFIRDQQNNDGSLPGDPDTGLNSKVNTAFAVMFLVRSSEILSLPPAGSELKGGAGLGKTAGKKLRAQSNGQIVAEQSSKDLNALLNDLGQDRSDAQLEDLADSIKDAVREYQKRPENSRGETRAFLKSLVSDRNYFKRLIAVKFLAGEQDLDNAPALIYALGDPDIRVCIEAHNGLRLISRKIDSIAVPSNPTLADFQRVKTRWTNWLLKLRPDANLLD